jgi:queuine tRNA-ribosyltransferase
VLTDAGKRNLRNARFAVDDAPLDRGCVCPVCARWSRGYLRHLLSVDEPTGRRLVTMHNVAWTLRFVDGMRAAIRGGRFAAFHQATTEVWGDGEGQADRDG